MAINQRFQVRDEELEELDKALLTLGYRNSKGGADRSSWYWEMKRKAIIEAEKISQD